MTDPKEQAKFDQDIANIRDTLPAYYWTMYSGCLLAGFNEEQSLRILIAIIQKPQDKV